MAVAKEKIYKKNIVFKDLLKTRIQKAPMLLQVQKKLNKIPVSLTKIVLEERKNF